MPRHDHENLGNAAQTFFVSGTLLKLSEDENGNKTGLCTVKIRGAIYCDVPLFYHCRGNSTLLPNGSLQDAPNAFKPGDQVIVQILGHLEDKVPCSDEDVCDPQLEGVTNSLGGGASVPVGGVAGVLPGPGTPLEATCDTTTTLQLSCGENGSQGGLRPSPATPQASADECVFDLSNDDVKEVLNAGESSSTFSNLKLSANSDAGASSDESECITVDYTPDCECTEGCTPGEVLCTETLPDGTQIDTICPEPDTPVCTTDGLALAIVGPTGQTIATGATFNFTSNAGEDCKCIWSTPDGITEGASVSYTAPSSNAECVADFIVGLTCIAADSAGNQTSETTFLSIGIDDSGSAVVAVEGPYYLPDPETDILGLAIVNFDYDRYDCQGNFLSTAGFQLSFSNCQNAPHSGPVGCCTATTGTGPCPGTGTGMGTICGEACCSDDDACTRWNNCGVFLDSSFYEWRDVRTALQITNGCCPGQIGNGADDPPCP